MLLRRFRSLVVLGFLAGAATACTSGSEVVATRQADGAGGFITPSPSAPLCEAGCYQGCVRGEKGIFTWAQIIFELVEAPSGEFFVLSKDAHLEGQTNDTQAATFSATLTGESACRAGDGGSGDDIKVSMRNGLYNGFNFIGEINGSYSPIRTGGGETRGGRFSGTWSADLTASASPDAGILYADVELGFWSATWFATTCSGFTISSQSACSSPH